MYGTDGVRLIRRDGGTGTTTLYLDGMELTSTGGAAPVATRYYKAAGSTVAMRTPSALTWLTADGQGSADLAIGATGAVSRQRYLPYGGLRGGDQISGDRGFLGKVRDDSTGLDLLGARYYDPAIGRFVSPDPQDNNDDPDYANPFSYASDDPGTLSDPTGLKPAECWGKCSSNWQNQQKKRARTHHGGRYHYHAPASHIHYGHRTVIRPTRASDCLVNGFFCGYRPPPPCLAQAFYCGAESMAHTVEPPKKKHWWQSVKGVLKETLPVVSIVAGVLAFTPVCPAVCAVIAVGADALAAGIKMGDRDWSGAAFDLAGAATMGAGRYIKAGHAAAELAHSGEGGQQVTRMAMRSKYGGQFAREQMNKLESRVTRWTVADMGHEPVDQALSGIGIGVNGLDIGIKLGRWALSD